MRCGELAQLGDRLLGGQLAQVKQVQVLAESGIGKAHQQTRSALDDPLLVGRGEDQRQEPLEQELPAQLLKGTAARCGRLLEPVLQGATERVGARVVRRPVDRHCFFPACSAMGRWTCGVETAWLSCSVSRDISAGSKGTTSSRICFSAAAGRTCSATMMSVICLRV